MAENSPERRQLTNGQWIEWKDVKLKKVIESLEFEIGRTVSDDRKTLVWYHIFDGRLENHRTLPKWETVEAEHLPGYELFQSAAA